MSSTEISHLQRNLDDATAEAEQAEKDGRRHYADASSHRQQAMQAQTALDYLVKVGGVLCGDYDRALSQLLAEQDATTKAMQRLYDARRDQYRAHKRVAEIQRDLAREESESAPLVVECDEADHATAA